MRRFLLKSTIALPTIARTLLPISVRKAIRPYWLRLIGAQEGALRAREIAKLGPAARWERREFREQEIAFWEEVLDVRRPDRIFPEVSLERMDWGLPLQPHITELLDASSGVVKILDVGAGPLTSLGKKWGSREIAITAIDPHAKEYDALLARLGIEPACRTTVGFAEELSKFLQESHFDLVHARNSMDHTKDPFQAIREMVKVVRQGKYVLLDHKIREGEVEKYAEYHQWNFFPRRSRFYIERPGMRAVDVGETLKGIADVSVGPSPDGPGRFCAKIRRIA